MSTYDDVKRHLQNEPCTWLVTGAAGFIGSNLVEALLRLDQRVVGLDNFATGYRHNLEDVEEQVGPEQARRFTFIEGDLRDLDACRAACAGVDYVLHQAALGSVPRSLEDPVATHEVNATGFLHMLVAARDAEVQRFVYASSSSVYGDDPNLPKVEAHTGTPLSPYAVSKRIDELYAHNVQRHYALETIGLRYFNVFGRRQDPHGAYAAVIPKWIALLLEGEPCPIYGDGETSRDFCYIANVVQANVLAACADGAATDQVYNVAYGDRMTLKELYATLRRLLEGRNGHEVPGPVYEDFRPGDVRHSQADIRAAREQLGYVPTHTAEEGLAEAMSWYVANAATWQAPVAKEEQWRATAGKR